MAVPPGGSSAFFMVAILIQKEKLLARADHCALPNTRRIRAARI
jgi:hypothetical protein